MIERQQCTTITDNLPSSVRIFLKAETIYLWFLRTQKMNRPKPQSLIPLNNHGRTNVPRDAALNEINNKYDSQFTKINHIFHHFYSIKQKIQQNTWMENIHKLFYIDAIVWWSFTCAHRFVAELINLFKHFFCLIYCKLKIDLHVLTCCWFRYNKHSEKSIRRAYSERSKHTNVTRVNNFRNVACVRNILCVCVL